MSGVTAEIQEMSMVGTRMQKKTLISPLSLFLKKIRAVKGTVA
jgi:hypothetical protein